MEYQPEALCARVLGTYCGEALQCIWNESCEDHFDSTGFDLTNSPYSSLSHTYWFWNSCEKCMSTARAAHVQEVPPPNVK